MWVSSKHEFKDSKIQNKYLNNDIPKLDTVLLNINMKAYPDVKPFLCSVAVL